MANPSQTDQSAPRAEETSPPDIDAGNYELIRDRLLAQSRELAGKAHALTEDRQAKFAATTTSVIWHCRRRPTHH